MAVEIYMPKMGMGMQEGTLIEWLKKEGAAVTVGEPIARIETNKVVTDLEAAGNGIFGNILVQAGSVVQIGTILAYIYAPGEEIPKRPEGSVARQITAKPAASPVKDHAEGGGKSDQISAGAQGHLTPVAKRAALQLGLNLEQVAAAFPGKHINREDVINWAQARQVKVASLDHEVIPMSNIRKAIAKRMLASLRESAQLTLIKSVDVTALVERRNKMVEEAEKLSQPRPTYTDLLAKAMALAIPAVPQINACLNGDKIEIMHIVNIGVAVATDEGLIAPVVKDVGSLTVFDISEKIQALAQRARQGQLNADEVDGSTITISNMGSEGIDAFTPILNPGEVAILGVGRIRSVWVPDADGKPEIRSEITLSLTIDHRVVDGVPAARYLGRLTEILSQPELLIQ
ncbi:MAG: 2-oxo acid dehydrogenase subunit E2 [Anaerolineales bacterium]|nr:2-oxo acid dehydrogenase subunit E2 [Anaerolineales bacterium]